MTDTPQIPTDQVIKPRITQVDVIPGAIKPRHLEIGLAAIKFGLAANRPVSGDIYPVYYAIDTFVLSLWAVDTWKTTTLT